MIPWVLTVTCGSLSGNLSKLDESNKSQSKSIVVSGKWYSPPEFETLVGKKARKLRQSLHHLGKPLSLYLFPSSLGTQGSSQGGQLDLSAGSQDVDFLSCSTPVSGVSSQPNVAESSRRLVSVSTSCDTFIC